MTYEDVIALQPKILPSKGTSLNYAKQFERLRKVIIWYGQIPSYRDPRRLSWGFAISDCSATLAWFNQYTCARRSAKRIYRNLKKCAEDRGFQVQLVVAEGSGISAADLE